MLRPERTSTIPNGIDLSHQNVLASSGRRESSTLEIVTVGRLVRQKGISVLLEAAGTVITRFPQVRFTLVGDGPLRRALEAQAAGLGLTEQVRFLGTLVEPQNVVAGCDLFVLPSLWEGMPMSLLEAMAAGRPVVASSVSGSAELILDEETGVLVPPGNPERLADAMIRMLENPEAAEAMGRRAADRVRREFSLERMLTSTDTLYRQLLAEFEPSGLEAQEVRLS